MVWAKSKKVFDKITHGSEFFYRIRNDNKSYQIFFIINLGELFLSCCEKPFCMFHKVFNFLWCCLGINKRAQRAWQIDKTIHNPFPKQVIYRQR